ncbi:MAG: type II toxin-antitoxin system HicB family antitoxin [Ignavibacteria bacterium]|nr:type II toxin-antitoxin system HicB family antitoxin [Ignavibacteria bacterium]
MTIQAIVHEEDGQFWAEVPSMPGCYTIADTLEEIPFYLKDAIEGWLEAAAVLNMNIDAIAEREGLRMISVNI